MGVCVQGVSLTETPLGRDTLAQRPLDIDPLDRDHPGQRPTWTPWIETTLDRDQPEQRPPGQRPPWTETTLDRDHPGQRPPWTETTLDRDHPGQRPLRETWDQRWRPPRRNMEPGSQTGIDIIQRPPVNRMTATCFWKYYPGPNFACGW